MYDWQQAQAEREQEFLVKQLFKLSNECERGILALRADGCAGIALVGPNCIMVATKLFDGVISDVVLN